jgi:hypothetical protein
LFLNKQNKAMLKRVMAKWSDSGKRDLNSVSTPYYYATIIAVNDSNCYDVMFDDKTVQKNTEKKYIKTEEQIKLENKLRIFEKFVVKTRDEIKRGSIYWKETANGKLQNLGKYLHTTVPWEGVMKGTKYERTFLHFSNLKVPIESCDPSDTFYTLKG